MHISVYRWEALTSQLKENINNSLNWFSSWYQEAFNGNTQRIEDLGATGDELAARLKELYKNNT